MECTGRLARHEPRRPKGSGARYRRRRWGFGGLLLSDLSYSLPLMAERAFDHQPARLARAGS